MDWKEKLKEGYQLLSEYPRIYQIGKWMLFVLGGLASLLFIFYWSVFFGLFGKLPSHAELVHIRNHVASEVYSSDGVLLGRYYLQNRTNVQYEDIAPEVIKALVATEDARFYEHNGIDNRSLLRVFFRTLILRDRSGGGGSTITQQLSKNLFGRKKYWIMSTPINKFREAIVATRIEDVYSKEEILTLYLNTVPFGEDTYGIETASERFFSVKPKALKMEEAAVLVGMLKANSAYNPRVNPDRSLNRRNTVLNQLTRYDFIKEEVADSLKALPLTIRYKRVTHNDGLAPYFREKIRLELEDWCKKQVKADGTPYNLYTDGLKITTSIHSKFQAYAEEAVHEHMLSLQNTFNNHWKNRNLWGKHKEILEKEKKKSERYKKMREENASEQEINRAFKRAINMEVFHHLGDTVVQLSPMDSIKYYQSFLHTGFLVMDPKQGDILAWVGGVNHKHFKYDHVTSQRQVGSTFKPIVYASALEKGMPPCEYIPNKRRKYKNYGNWSPRNADGVYKGKYSLTGGLTNSVNTISVEVLVRTGIGRVIDLAKRMGITSLLPKTPTLALGVADVSLKEMLGVYTTFANKGKQQAPNYLLEIKNAKGTVLYKRKREKGKNVITSTTAHTMTKMLQSVIDNGTGQRLRSKYRLKMDIAGKTGTTQSHADGWFIGYTPDLLGGVWVGAEDRRVHFRTIEHGQGANMALPIWALFMQKISKDPDYALYKNAKFDIPADVLLEMECPMYEDENVIESIINKIFDKDKRIRKPSPANTPSRKTPPPKRKKVKLKDLFKKKN